MYVLGDIDRGEGKKKREAIDERRECWGERDGSRKRKERRVYGVEDRERQTRRVQSTDLQVYMYINTPVYPVCVNTTPITYIQCYVTAVPDSVTQDTSLQDVMLS